MPVLWIIWARWLIRLRRLKFITGERWTLTLSTTELSSTWGIFWSKYTLPTAYYFGCRHSLNVCVYEGEDDADIVSRSQGKEEEAERMLKESIRFGPHFADAYSSLASLYADQVLLSVICSRFITFFKKVFCTYLFFLSFFFLCVCVGTFKRSEWNLHQGYRELSRQFWPP